MNAKDLGLEYKDYRLNCHIFIDMASQVEILNSVAKLKGLVMALTVCLFGWLNYQPKTDREETKMSEIIQKRCPRLKGIRILEWIYQTRPAQLISSLCPLGKSRED